MISRREFSQQVAVAGLGLAAGSAARAQGGPVEGREYVKLTTPAPVAAPAGKIEVLEFFWYGCPHCHELEPALEAWIKTLPPDVSFQRVPVGFGAMHVAHQKLFYALESLGVVDKLHGQIFRAIQINRQRLDTEAEQAAFVEKHGVDAAKFKDAFKSFTVATKSSRAKQLTEAYKIDGVPALGVGGRFYTAGSLAGDNRRALDVANFLIKRVRDKR